MLKSSSRAQYWGACLAAGLALSACSQSPSSSELNDATIARRVNATHVTFTSWTDTLQIDAAVKSDGTKCQIVDPLVSDDSTNWRPFQLYWVIRDDSDDVTKSSIQNIFFAGDMVAASQFPGALGFAYLDNSFASMLELKALSLAPDRSAVQATIGSPFNAVLRLETVLDGEACTTRTLYCSTSADCSSLAAFKPLGSIHVKQNFFNYPTSVVFN